MAEASTTLPREVQSDLHDLADDIGEKVARGELVEMSYVESPQTASKNALSCTCIRYSERHEDGIHFWYKSDPNCEYIHLQPLPMAHKVKL